MSELKANRLNSIVQCIAQGGAAGVTRRQIAACLGLKVTPYLTGLIQTVMDAGYASAQMDYSVYPPANRYYLTESAVTE